MKTVFAEINNKCVFKCLQAKCVIFKYFKKITSLISKRKRDWFKNKQTKGGSYPWITELKKVLKYSSFGPAMPGGTLLMNGKRFGYITAASPRPPSRSTVHSLGRTPFLAFTWLQQSYRKIYIYCKLNEYICWLGRTPKLDI